MPIGPGRYDDVCTMARARVGITDTTGGGVVLIVVGGKHGPGFSCQADLLTTMALPEYLEFVANEIRNSRHAIGRGLG